MVNSEPDGSTVKQSLYHSEFFIWFAIGTMQNIILDLGLFHLIPTYNQLSKLNCQCGMCSNELVASQLI